MEFNQSNPYLRKLDELAYARKQWAESEWRLKFLRTTEPEPTPAPNQQQLLTWIAQTTSPKPLN